MRLSAGRFHNRLWPPCSQRARHDGSMEVSKQEALVQSLSSLCYLFPWPYPLHSRWHSLIRHYLGVLGTQARRPHWNPFCTQTIKASKPGQCLGYIRRCILPCQQLGRLKALSPLLFPVCIFLVIQEVSSLESVRSPTPRRRDKNTHCLTRYTLQYAIIILSIDTPCLRGRCFNFRCFVLLVCVWERVYM